MPSFGSHNALPIRHMIISASGFNMCIHPYYEEVDILLEEYPRLSFYSFEVSTVFSDETWIHRED
jgi:hypothetical protein